MQGTINGYGERIGNANLCSVIPNLVLKLGYSCTAQDRLSDLSEVSHFFDELANMASNPRLPFVGDAAFAHKGGIHVQAVALDPSTYEHVDPAVVGNERRILVSELSGRNNVIERARQLGLELDPESPVAREVAGKIKELESEGFRFEDAEASFELLVRRALGRYARPFEPLAYAVDARRDADGKRAGRRRPWKSESAVRCFAERQRAAARSCAGEGDAPRAIAGVPAPGGRLADGLPVADRASG